MGSRHQGHDPDNMDFAVWKNDELVHVEMTAAAQNLSMRKKGRLFRDQFLARFEENGCNVTEALHYLGNSPSNYHYHRRNWPDFVAKIEAIRNREAARTATAKDMPKFVGNGRKWIDGFASFRKYFFGFDSPWFHLEVVNILEEKIKEFDKTGKAGGTITLILLPPEHGKTTLLEDFCTYMLVQNPGTTITVGSESQDTSRKRLGRVRSRLESEGPSPMLVKTFGPFEPQTGRGSKTNQPWGQDYFNIFYKRGEDDREHSMQALGMGSRIAGTRCQLLLCDDVTSLQNYNQTEKLVEVFRQDWLSRPGVTGHTVIIGTRVGEMDFYETLISEGIVDHLVEYPAIDDQGNYLWPEKYSPTDYDRLRRNVGEDAWWRNYMQQPRAAGDATFGEDAIQRCLVEGANFEDMVVPGFPIYIGVDPALGGTCAVSAWQHTDKEFRLVDLRTERKLVRTEQIMGLIEGMVLSLNDMSPEMNVRVTDVIIENNAYQKGLVNDLRLQEMSQRLHFSIMGHHTGTNKYDEVIGVPQMERSMLQGKVKIPFGADPRTRAAVEHLCIELRTWRPLQRGNRLRQDRLMSMWFAWILWRNRQAWQGNLLVGDDWSGGGYSSLLGAEYKPLPEYEGIL